MVVPRSIARHAAKISAVETVNVEFGKWKCALPDQRDLLAANVTFFANSDMPSYIVIIGEAPEEELETLLQVQ